MKTALDLKSFVRDVPDFPKPGILFRDITPLLSSPSAFEETVDLMAEEWEGKVDAIAALDARGFVFGAPLALKLKLPLILVRKKGKLPGKTIGISYGLEYGKDSVEVSVDTLPKSGRVLVVDDLLATGGTANAACSLLEKAGLEVAGCAFVIELLELSGKEVLAGRKTTSVISY
jgi:adenine phosphoribosyltransferase